MTSPPVNESGRRLSAPPRSCCRCSRIRLQTEADASLELDVVGALALGRDGVILAEEVHLGLRADRESDAGTDVEAELGLRVLRLGRTIVDLRRQAVETSTALREEARAHLRAEVHAQ